MTPGSAGARPAEARVERVGRPSIDTLLLAAFAAADRSRVSRVADLGAGSGEAALALASRVSVGDLELFEANAEECARCDEAVRAAGVRARVHALELGRDALPADVISACDLVVCNPPYHDPERGRPPAARRAAARVGSVEPFLDATAQLLTRRGRACFVYPADELSRLVVLADGRGLRPKRLRLVHATPTSPARIALVAFASARPGGLLVEPPCVEWESPAQRTDELTELVR